MNHELCFIWGPPHSGQLRWMVRSVEEGMDSQVMTSLLPLANSHSPDSLKEALQSAKSHLIKAVPPHIKSHHVYCELPWNLIDEDYEVEEWLEENLSARSDLVNSRGSDWNLSFVGLCPFSAEKLPLLYREGLENFARASQSGIIVTRRELDPAEPDWLGSGLLDFGRTVEVFDEAIWAAKGELPLERGKLPDFSDSDEALEFHELALFGDKNFYRKLLWELAKGSFGKCWGAEISWRGSTLGVTENLSLSDGHINSWQADHPSLSEGITLNGAKMTFSGKNLILADIKNAASSQNNFC